MINTLRAQKNVKKNMSNVSREMETLGGKKEMWEIKNTTTVIKNYFDGFMSTLDTSKEKISVSLKLCQ